MNRVEMEFVDKVAQYRSAIRQIQTLSVDDKEEVAILRKMISELEIEIDSFIKDFFD